MKKFLLVLIFFLALFLRLYKLGQYPVGFLWDEASLGYNAYSILKTGRDEYGQFLPVIFKSFGDYKPGLFVYLTIPSVAVFGLNEFAVRFPSAFLGSLSVLIFYFLVKESLAKEISKMPLVCALLLAVSPWHLVFSRGSWELNVMLLEFLLGFYLLLKFLATARQKFLYFSAVSFLLTLITYQSAKFLLPVLLFGFFIFGRKNINRTNKKAISFYVTGLIVVFAVFIFWTVWAGKGGRVKAMSLFSYPRSSQETQMFLTQDNGSLPVFNFFHGKPVFFVRSVLGRYFNHFSGKFLFFGGDWSNQRNGITYQGVLYYLDVVFLALGFFQLFTQKRSFLANFMLFWLVAAPLPSALTRDSISSVRSFTMVIPLVYIVAIGITEMFEYLKRFPRSVKIAFYILHFTFYILLFIRLVDLYFTHDPKYTSENRLYGYKQAVLAVRSLASQKNKVVFTDKYGQPYIFYLFYTQYSPKEYQKQAFLKENPFGDVGRVEKIDNIEFKKIYWPEERGFQNSLFIGDELELPLADVVNQNNITMLEEIKFLNGKTAFRLVETK